MAGVYNTSGVYQTTTDNTLSVSTAGILSAGIVIDSNRGPVGEVRTVTSLTAFRSTYGLANRDHPSMFCAERHLKRSNVLSVVRMGGNAVAATATLQVEGVDALVVTAHNPGAWGNGLAVDIIDVSSSEGAGIFRVVVKENDVQVEAFLASRDPEARDGFGNIIFIEDAINGVSNYITVEDQIAFVGTYTFGADVIELAGGSDNTDPILSADIVSAWSLFENADAVPANLLINAGFTATEVQNKMLEVAITRGNCRAILDVPFAARNSVQAMIDHRNEVGISSQYASMYGGWVTFFDENSNLTFDIPPSGSVAARENYTIENGTRWSAPAGVENGVIDGMVGTSITLSETDRGLLAQAQINPITSLGGNNAVITEQLTMLTSTSALQSINVVNLLNWANARMKESLLPYVHRSNTAKTRENINYMLTSFLNNIKEQDGIYDFKVDTGSELNTGEVIDAEKILVDIYIKPVRTARFIEINSIITKTGVSFN